MRIDWEIGEKHAIQVNLMAGLAIWFGFPDITHIKKIMTVAIIGHFGHHDLVSARILPNFELIRAISEVDIWYKFWNHT